MTWENPHGRAGARGAGWAHGEHYGDTGMTSVLVLYMSQGGHTARIARRICESIERAGPV